jgi:hypothetical protein
MEAGVIPIDCKVLLRRSCAVAGEGKELKSTTRSRVGRGLPIYSHRARDIRFCGILRSSAGSTPRASERRPTTLRLA